MNTKAGQENDATARRAEAETGQGEAFGVARDLTPRNRTTGKYGEKRGGHRNAVVCCLFFYRQLTGNERPMWIRQARLPAIRRPTPARSGRRRRSSIPAQTLPDG